jgi:class 3 adenylate cyclase
MLKLVTVLFADVVGSTARAEAAHPEDVRALMTSYFDAMAGEIRAEGGTLEKFVGDAIMAVFGVPTAHEDDPVRAVRAARRMLERLRTWNGARDPAERLEIRIGIETGDVVASGDATGELLVTGDSVNVAARLQQVAEPGTIVVGERTARSARTHFVLRELEEPLGLKGKSAPVAAWVVVGERDTVEERGVPGLRAPLVGRERELNALRAELERVNADRRPALVTLLGDAGIGKSRLVREFLSGLDDETAVLIGRCLPSGQGTTLLPLADMLEARANVFDSDAAESALAKIAGLVDGEVDDDVAGERTVAALASTLGLGDDTGDPRERQRELVDAWRALFASLARRAPVVAVVEDLHWADPRMLDILDELAERVEGPILFVCTSRSDLLRVRPEWGGGRRGFSSLPLDALSTEDSALLVSLLLEIDLLPDATRNAILERSEGNPFFLEEIIRHLIDEGLLVFDEGRWRAREDIAAVDLPDSVQAVILARLDLLSAEEKRVAQRAAVIGRFFWDGALAAVAGTNGKLDAVLGTLRRREFVLERISSSIAGQREFLFKHVLIRDVAYESLPRRERGRAHVETAAWLERTAGGRAADLSEQLAHHYESAYGYLQTDDLRCKARGSLLDAAAGAHRRFATEQVERLARRAVDLSQPGAERVEALEALGDRHYHVGDAAWRAYAEALAELSEDDPTFARLAAKAAQFGSRWVGTMAELPAIEDVRRLIAAGLRTARPHSSERARLLVDEGFLLLQRERRLDDVADRAVDDAVAEAEAAGDPDIRSAALDLAAARSMYRGRYGEMRREIGRRTELVPMLRDVKEIGDTYAMGGWSAHHIGLYREAEARATACIERSREVDAGAYLHGLTWRVAARFMLGDWTGALADQAELERVADLDARDLPAGFTIRAYTYTALCHELRGDQAALRRYLDLAFAMHARTRVDATRPLGSLQFPPLARALAHLGRFDEALAFIPLEPRSGSAGLTLEALCEIALARGDWPEAGALSATVREEAAHGELVALPLFADRLDGRAAAAAGDAARAVDLLRRSADGFARLEARWEESFSRLLLAEVLVESDGGSAQRELLAALPVFEQLGSVKEAAQAQALLAAVPA